GGLILLAGCAAPQPVARQVTAPGQQIYQAKVLAIRPVSAGLALAQVMQTLGEPDAVQETAAQEVVVQMPDGSVKSLVPPPGTVMEALAPGADVLISETPQLRILAR
ncbi:MAG: hypothetical protein KGL63_08400, partial [Betaproteobacteria bacterium]|nr:hypothetical protein [Betaproteobacteria bacterium]